MNINWKYLFLFAMLFLIRYNYLHAQSLPGNFNLIPNGSFEFNAIGNETYLNDTDFVHNKSCWIKANSIGGAVRDQSFWDQQIPGSPRPYRGAKSVELVLAALNNYNIQIPLESQDTFQGTRSYIQTRLLEPLSAGQSYYLTLYIGGSKLTRYIQHQYEGNVMTNLGVLFTKEQVRDYQQSGMIARTPQIRFANWPTTSQLDTFQYKKLSGIYIASGGEQYITIGNFDSLQDLHIAYIKPDRISNDTNYDPLFRAYIDNISLVSDTTLSLISPDEWDLGSDTVICSGGMPHEPIILGHPGGFFHYWWNTGDTTSTIEINQSGTYWCTVDFGCNTYTDSIQVTYIDDSLPVIDLGNDTSICNDYDFYDSLVLKVDNCLNCHFLWNTGDTASQITINQPQQYWVSVRNVCGIGSDSITILGCPEKEIPEIWFPNAFSPNGDGLNDRFCAPYPPVQVVSAEMTIYNRWGQKIITIFDIGQGWDGKNADVGVYYYVLYYTDIIGNHHSQKGEITLIR